MNWGTDLRLSGKRWAFIPVAHVDRVPEYDSGGSRFKSCQGYVSEKEEDPEKTQKVHPSWDALKKVEKLAKDAEKHTPKDKKKKK